MYETVMENLFPISWCWSSLEGGIASFLYCSCWTGQQVNSSYEKIQDSDSTYWMKSNRVKMHLHSSGRPYDPILASASSPSFLFCSVAEAFLWASRLGCHSEMCCFLLCCLNYYLPSSWCCAGGDGCEWFRPLRTHGSYMEKTVMRPKVISRYWLTCRELFNCCI